jgi:hypothetical protein
MRPEKIIYKPVFTDRVSTGEYTFYRITVYQGDGYEPVLFYVEQGDNRLEDWDAEWQMTPYKSTSIAKAIREAIIMLDNIEAANEVPSNDPG